MQNLEMSFQERLTHSLLLFATLNHIVTVRRSSLMALRIPTWSETSIVAGWRQQWFHRKQVGVFCLTRELYGFFYTHEKQYFQSSLYIFSINHHVFYNKTRLVSGSRSWDPGQYHRKKMYIFLHHSHVLKFSNCYTKTNESLKHPNSS